jgi:hypothetical protein
MSGSRNQPQKRKGLTLDLNAATTKKPKTASHILTSPDVQMLKLTSPELAEFLTRNPTLATPTPSGNTILFPKTVTEEQELYAKGFEVALKNMHQGPGGSGGHIISTAHPPPPPLVQYKTEPAPSNASAIEAIERATAAHRAQSKMPIMATSEVLSPRPSSSASGSMDSTDQIRIKEELDDSDAETDDDEDDYSEEEEIPSNQNNFRGGRKSSNKRLSLMAPIDMKSQEKVKLERKRQRNRLAASKCRKRKLERISHLEGKVTGLKGENVELANVVKKLKESVYSLKQEVLEHHTNGCLISMQEIVYSTTAS